MSRVGRRLLKYLPTAAHCCCFPSVVNMPHGQGEEVGCDVSKRLKSITSAWIASFSVLLMCLMAAAVVGGGGRLCVMDLEKAKHNTWVACTLHPTASDGERAHERKRRRNGVTKQPAVTLMEWKQKPGVWQKHPAWSKKSTQQQQLYPKSD